MACPSLTPAPELRAKLNANWLDASSRRYERAGEESYASAWAGSVELAPAAAASPPVADARRRFLRAGVLGFAFLSVSVEDKSFSSISAGAISAS